MQTGRLKKQSVRPNGEPKTQTHIIPIFPLTQAAAIFQTTSVRTRHPHKGIPSMTDNVLLHLGEEPRFDAIQTADIKPALQTAIAEARAQIAEIKAQTHTDWANTVERLTDIT